MVSSALSRNWWFYRVIFAIVRPFSKSLVSAEQRILSFVNYYQNTKIFTQQQAAATTVYCATANELTGITGQYYNNCYFCQPSVDSMNDVMSTSLWETSERLIKQILNEKL